MLRSESRNPVQMSVNKLKNLVPLNNCYERKKELISAMKNIQIIAQYIALERTDNVAIDAHFSVYPKVEYKKINN